MILIVALGLSLPWRPGGDRFAPAVTMGKELFQQTLAAIELNRTDHGSGPC
jgi:hypothetical protein